MKRSLCSLVPTDVRWEFVLWQDSAAALPHQLWQQGAHFKLLQTLLSAAPLWLDLCRPSQLATDLWLSSEHQPAPECLGKPLPQTSISFIDLSYCEACIKVAQLSGATRQRGAADCYRINHLPPRQGFICDEIQQTWWHLDWFWIKMCDCCSVRMRENVLGIVTQIASSQLTR